MKHIVSNRNIRCLAIAGFFATGTTWGVTQWANLYMVKQLGVTAIYTGQVMSVFGTAALIANQRSVFYLIFCQLRRTI
ncbi:MAG: hypothetical protein ACLRZ2_01605 [Veillonella sp.]